MANTINIQPQLIRWAVERSGLELSSYPAEIADWIRGNKAPTLSKLEKFARKAMVPFGYLFLDSPPVETLPVPDYRTMRDAGVRRPSPNLLDTLYDMQRRQAWMREYLLEEGHDSLSFVGSVTRNTPIDTVVTSMYRVLDLPRDWATRHETWEKATAFLVSQIERAGVLVFINGVVGNSTKRKLDPEEFRGFVLCDEIAPLIFVNATDSKAAQVFTLAHELAHLWLGSDALVNLPEMQPGSDESEKFCNRVAAEFLVPQSKLQAAWASYKNEDRRFEKLSKLFKASPVAIARRAKDLRLISADEFFRFYEDYQAKAVQIRREQTGGDFYKTQKSRLGNRFGRAVIAATKMGRLSYQDAYELTRLYGQTFDRYAAFLQNQERA
jgi:Zn-dependent peptidase ImmA (M78 family)